MLSKTQARKMQGGRSVSYYQKCELSFLKSGVGNGNRTRNRRSHSPVLCQLSYSHRRLDYSNCAEQMSETRERGRAKNSKSGRRRSRGSMICTLRCITFVFTVTDLLYLD